MLGPAGPTLHTVHGGVFVPWSCVERLRLRTIRRDPLLQLGFRRVPTDQGWAGQPAVSGDLSAKELHRLFRRGALIGSAAVQEDLGTVVEAAQRLAGRPLLVP